MASDPMLEQTLDLTKVEVQVDGEVIHHLVDRENGGGVVMLPEEGPTQGRDPRLFNIAHQLVGWIKDKPELVGVTGMISVLTGSESANYLSRLANASKTVSIVFNSNDSGLGFETQRCDQARIFHSDIAIERNSVRRFVFVGAGYHLTTVAETSSP